MAATGSSCAKAWLWAELGVITGVGPAEAASGLIGVTDTYEVGGSFTVGLLASVKEDVRTVRGWGSGSLGGHRRLSVRSAAVAIGAGEGASATGVDG